MTRRVDVKTAELVELALLTRAAFEQERGIRYAKIAGVPDEVINRIFAFPPGRFRLADGSIYSHAYHWPEGAAKKTDKSLALKNPRGQAKFLTNNRRPETTAQNSDPPSE